ncbi:MAG: PCMD domain-containing protein [Odoribacter sp.]|nr:PCMD domain-containing protein [Odoribacter sp.]
MPKAAPKVTFSADGQEGGSVATTEGVSKKARIMVSAAAGLTELKIKTVSDTLLARGWPAEFDLMKATEAQKEVLKSNGLLWSENVDKQDTIKSAVWLLFDDVVKLLSTAPQKTTVSAFEIFAKDRFAQEGDGRFDVKVAPPVFEFVNAPGEGNVWAKRAVYDVKYVSERETPVVECRGADGQWKALETTLTEKNTDEYECLAKGLAPATDYAFRVRLGGHTLEAGSYVTEVDAQVPNSGFEEWSEEMVWKKTIAFSGGKEVYAFYPYASGTTDTWWNTRNRTTTQSSDGVASWFYAAYPGTVPTAKSGWTATEHLNSYGGTNLSSRAYAGNSAMEIATVGWGKNNWSAASKTAANKTAGALYIGDYDLATHTESFGHAFASRPVSIQFYYRFYSYNNETTKAYAELKDETGEVIGYGEFRITNSTDVYQKGIIEIIYYSQVKRISTFTIVFLSTDSESPATSAIQGSEGAIGKGYGDSRHIGSVLTVDEVELVY